MKQTHGFTLIELILVIALLGITTSLTLPRFVGILEAQSLSSGAQELASELRYAQSLALAGNCRHRVEFILEQRKFNLYSERDGRLTLLESKELPQGIDYEAVTFKKTAGMDGPWAGFTNRGSPSSGGTVILRNRHGNTLELTVMLATGRVLVKE